KGDAIDRESPPPPDLSPPRGGGGFFLGSAGERGWVSLRTTPTEYPLPARRFATRREMGRAAAADIADFLRGKIAVVGGVRVVFAAADSQRDMLESLVGEQGLDWGRVTAFHMDEYVGP